MLSRKICRPKVVVRSLFWMICKGFADRPSLSRRWRENAYFPIVMSRTTHGLEIGQDLTPMYSTVVPVNEQMGKGLSQMGLARP